MADEKRGSGATDGFGTGGPEDSDFGALTGGDSGLGNLPPLSDFESSSGGGGGFDSGLPPLSAIDPSSDKDRISIGGLPPISDIPVETPIPTGGAVRPAPAGYGSTPVFGTPSSDSGLDTPSGSGFQDLSADSDFTPETPEVAPPGPESDIDTPLFDSAFGGGSAAFSAADTSAPTQAMQTPMFTADAGGFDPDAFAPSSRPSAQSRGGFEGTPIPDFGPDTTAPTAMTPPPAMGAGVVAGGPPPKKSKTGLWAAIAALVGVLIGAGVGPMIPFVPNPKNEQVTSLQTENDTLKKRVADMQKVLSDPGATTVSPEALEELIAKQAAVTQELEAQQKQQETLTTEIQSLSTQRDTVQTELEQLNTEYVTAQADFEQLANETAIFQARKDGLAAEADRLENQVGKLEAANSRSMMTKETLESNIDRLLITVQEGSPLTPEKYSRSARIERVQALKDKASSANWVDPALLDEYTSLYLAELEISQSREYFFAKLPVVDRFGTRSNMWAECVMNGNHGIYYRTLDGQHIGVYQNVAAEGPAKYTFIDLKTDSPEARQLEAEIFAARTPGYEEKLELLAQRQLVTDEKTDLQKKFDSL